MDIHIWEDYINEGVNQETQEGTIEKLEKFISVLNDVILFSNAKSEEVELLESAKQKLFEIKKEIAISTIGEILCHVKRLN